jgi:hypothetical protein
MRRMRRIVLLALALLAVAPATASARFAKLPGTGQTPTVAIDGTGTAVVAWYQYDASRGEAVALCRIPKGTKKCPAVQILDATAGATSGVQPPLLRISGPSVDLVAARQFMVAFHSADGGATFGPQVPIGDNIIYFAGAIGADGTVAVGDGATFQATHLAGPLEQRTLNLNPGTSSFQAVGFSGGRPVYVSGGAAPRTSVRQWSGTGDIMDASTWSRRRVGPVMVYYALDNGPRGLWLVHEHRVTGGDVVVVRRFRKGRFGPARTIPGSLGNVLDTAIAQDSKGRFAVAWYDSRRDAVRISASRKGRRWSRAKTVAQFPNFPSRMSIGLGSDGRGLLVTDQGSLGRRVLVGRIDVKRLTRRR